MSHTSESSVPEVQSETPVFFLEDSQVQKLRCDDSLAVQIPEQTTEKITLGNTRSDISNITSREITGTTMQFVFVTSITAQLKYQLPMASHPHQSEGYYDVVLPNGNYSVQDTISDVLEKPDQS